jgi:hypothetical protein
MKSLPERFKKHSNIVSRIHHEITLLQARMYEFSSLLFFREAHDRKRQDYVVSFLAVMEENPAAFERGGRWQARAIADIMRLMSSDQQGTSVEA